MSLRFFGLFLVMPILAIDALNLEDGSPILAGIAIGGYALTQMLLQYPFGALSDRFGRKTMIAIGMAIFAAGSIICAFADNIYILILGRFIQGAGAISAVIMAMIGDLTPEEERSKAMAFMGMSIALSFITAFILGPIAGGYYRIGALFLVSAFLVLPALFALFVLVPTPPKITRMEPLEGSRIRRVFANKNLFRLNFAMFLHSFTMTCSFYIIPIVLTREQGYETHELWKVYIPALICGILAMGAGAAIGEKKNAVKKVMLLGVALLTAVFALIAIFPNAIVAWVILLFVGINSLEPLMQSSATKFAKASERGSALGIFNTFQFAGVFFGGLIAGHLYGFYGLSFLASALALFCVAWFLITLKLENPRRTKILAIEKSAIGEKSIEKIAGVIECYRVRKLYVRYDPSVVSDETLLKSIIGE